MARNLGNQVQNHFGAGLVTEATSLNFPPNAAVDTQNCVFTLKGTCARRYPFYPENGAVGVQLSNASVALSEYYWQGAGGIGTANFAIIQHGMDIFIYQALSDASLSSEYIANFNFIRQGYVNPLPFGVKDSKLLPMQFASGYGYLFVSHPYCDPVYISYDPPTGTFNINQFHLMQRDFAGIDEGTPTNYRPPITMAADGLSGGNTPHIYNLINQGWRCTLPSNGYQGFIVPFQTAFGAAPSNSDFWWAYKDSTGAYSPSTVVNSLGNSPAPGGHFLVPCFNIDRIQAFNAEIGDIFSTADYVNLPVETSGYWRPSCVAFYAGRVFHAGTNSTQFSNSIYFSQILDSPDKLGLCYQVNDPTADDTGIADLLASDGGVIINPDIGQVFKMFSIGYSLLIFASNGVWALSGSTGTGFTATDYSLSKISSVGMVSATSFVDLDGVPVWWNTDGIYTLASMPTTGAALGATGTSVVSMTDGVIKTFFDSIPVQAKYYVKGSYNRRLHTIYWLYTSFDPIYNRSVLNSSGNTLIDQENQTTIAYHYDRLLCFNTLTKAFFPWTLPGVDQFQNIVGPCIQGVVTVQGQGTYEDGVTTAPMSQVTKFLYADPNNGIVSFAETYPLGGFSYTDWGVNIVDAYTVSGYTLDGQALGKFQSPYLVFYMASKVASQVSVRMQWNFATDTSTGKISTSELLITEGGNRQDFAQFKRKLRGTGRSLQLRFDSVGDYPFEISGWAIQVSVNTLP